MFVSPRLGSRVFLTVDVVVLFLCRVFRLVSVARRRAHFYPDVVDDFVVVWMVWFLVFVGVLGGLFFCFCCVGVCGVFSRLGFRGTGCGGGCFWVGCGGVLGVFWGVRGAVIFRGVLTGFREGSHRVFLRRFIGFLGKESNQ